jgi:CMP-N,N'-diacetyllegionaminic acid synthase
MNMPPATPDQSRPQVLAVIPVDAGASPLALSPVHGRPLLSYSVQHARDVPGISRTLVLTGEERVAHLARRLGAGARLMPGQPCAAAELAWLGLLLSELLLSELPSPPRLLVLLRPGYALRDPRLTGRAIHTMLDSPRADSMLSVTVAEQSPYKMWRLDTEDRLVPVIRIPGLPESHSMPRQRLPVVYWPNGSLDLVRPQTILEQGSMTGRVVLPLVMPRVRGHIASFDDIPAAEDALRAYCSQEQILDHEPPGRVPV